MNKRLVFDDEFARHIDAIKHAICRIDKIGITSDYINDIINHSESMKLLWKNELKYEEEFNPRPRSFTEIFA